MEKFPTELLEQEGIFSWGISGPQLPGEWGVNYRSWLECGFNSDMKWLAQNLHAKWDAAGLQQGTLSVISVAVNCYRTDKPLPAGCGRVARFARGRDYHKALGGRLRRIVRRLERRFPDGRFRSFVDAVPLSERGFAVQAGLGERGWNTLLLHPRYGSWTVIGEIVTTVQFQTECSEDFTGTVCQQCGRCIAACPTGALRGPGVLDAGRCLAYLTVENRAAIPLQYRGAMGCRVFGCDLCQEVCPVNRDAVSADWPDFERNIAGEALSLQQLLEIPDREGFVNRFAGSQLMRAGRSGLLRNAAVAAANCAAVELLPLLHRLSREDDQTVAEHALWAAQQLENK